MKLDWQNIPNTDIIFLNTFWKIKYVIRNKKVGKVIVSTVVRHKKHKRKSTMKKYMITLGD